MSGVSKAGGLSVTVMPEAAPKRLLQWMTRFRREMGVVALFSGVANLMMLMPTLYMLQVYDRVLLSGSELTLLAVSLMALFLYGVMAFAEWCRGRVLVRTGLRMNDLLAERVFCASFDEHLRKPGLNPGRSLSDLTEFRQFLTGTGPIAVFDAPWTVVYLAVLFLLHPVLGWTGVGFAVFQSVVAWRMNRGATAPAQALAQAQQESVAQVQAKLRMAEVVESMGMLGALHLRWQGYQQRYLKQHAVTFGGQHRATAISKGLRYAQQSLVLGVGALLVIDGELSGGAMIAANALASRALAPIDQLVATWKGFVGAFQAYGRLSGLLESAGALEAEAVSRVLPEGLVELKGVVARAPAADPASVPILKGVDLALAPGEVTVLMGPSGSGKSTLAKVLLGVWPASGGDVLWGGRPLSGWTAEERGPLVGYLAQDVELFDGTMADNIARMAVVDSPKVIAAAQMAGLHDTILHLPSGYDTPVVAAGGGALSGGQRQRLGLARALYGEPMLVVLDEPNANLDDAGETALMQAIAGLKAQGSAVLVISHRPGVLKGADRLVWMQDGRIDLAGARDDVVAQLNERRASAQKPA